AAAAAIDLERYDLALEWLEQSRSIIWNQTLQLRTPLDELAVVDPSLAKQLARTACQLDQSISLTPSDHSNLSTNANSIEQAAQQHHRLAEQWDRLLDEARQLPGMSGLLRPKKASELIRAAVDCTFVVLNVYGADCDALVIPSNATSVTRIPLQGFSYDIALELHAQLTDSLRYANIRDRGYRRPMFNDMDGEDRFEDILAALWTCIVQPILSHLGYLNLKPGVDLPRIAWCTTGPLAFLPLHAAGLYDRPDSKVFDYVVSSYTPTISTTMVSSEPPSHFRGILAVGQANAAGCSPLPGTIDELEAISAQAIGLPYTQLDDILATPEAVITAMETHDWVHLACHGSQNTADPTKSAFHLHGGTLDLSTITRKSITGASLAFLSACQTATGDEKLPEEAVHLAAGMMVAGYRSVIATMWSIHDSDAPLIAENVYGSLLEGGEADASKAARALHDAVGHLRNKVGEKEYSRWVPYVHFGK
ncbi:hypothetical protein FRC09_017353, partial [Ceratobasidium sp. 395]